jgi:hypothetical protein
MLTTFEKSGCSRVVFAALLLVVGARFAQAQLGLGLAPMKVELKMAPGQVYSNTLKLSSGAGDKLRVRGERLDFQVDDKATPQFERNLPQEASFSCKPWLSLNPTEIELEKDGFLMVRYSLRVPADVAEGSYACAAGFTTLPSADAMQDGMGMRMAVRIVATYYVQVGSPAIDGALKEIKLEPVLGATDSESGLQAVVVLENRGKMYFRPTGKLEVLDAEGSAVETADFASLPVLRERQQRFLFPLKTRLAPGQYKLRAQVDLGTKEVQQGTVDVVINAPAPAAALAKPEQAPAGADSAPVVGAPRK